MFHVNLFTLSVTATVGNFWLFFFLFHNVHIFPMSMSETLSYLPNVARFHSRNPTKFFAERLTITAIPKTRIIVICVDAHCSEVTDLICSFVAPSQMQTLLDFKFLVSLLNVILKISPSQRSEQKRKNKINSKDITQYQNMHYMFHLVATESSICMTKSFQILLNFKRYFGCEFREYKDGIRQLLIIFGDLR